MSKKRPPPNQESGPVHRNSARNSGYTYASIWNPPITCKICFSDKGIVNRRFHASWNRFVSISFFLQIILFVISSFSCRSAGIIPVLRSTCHCRYS